MARRRVETDRLRELVRLHRMGTSGRETTRLLRMGSNTYRKYRHAIEAAGLLDGAPADPPDPAALHAAIVAALGPPGGSRPASSFEPWRDHVGAMIDKGLGARAIFDRLRLDTHRKPAGSYSALKRFVRKVRGERGGDASAVAIPVDTAPGEVAQVDFGYAGKLYDPERGVLRRAWIFVMLACHSRFMFLQVVFDQSVETWLRLHEEAFRTFGGVVSTVVPDNTRRAVLRAAFGVDGASDLNRSYRELARHYGFKIDPAPPGAPRKKGKVEAAVKYVRNNPLKGRGGEPIDEVQAALQRWNREVASTRVHGTTGRRPIDVFETEERAVLRPLPTAPFEVAVWRTARVHPDSHVCFRERLYSVSWRLIHEQVWVRGTAKTIEVFRDDQLVATHARTARWRTTDEAHLPPDRRELRHRGRVHWETRAARIGPASLALARTIFDSDAALSRLRQVQAVVTHLERYPAARAEAAALRALRTGEHSYRGVRQTLTLGLDLERAAVSAVGSPASPATRFAAQHPKWVRREQDVERGTG